MRVCPRCRCVGISAGKLYLYALTRLNCVSCVECHAVVGFEKRENLFGGFVASIFSELVFFLMALALFLITGSVFFVFSVLISLNLLKALIIYREPLIEIQ
jgi:uncharacterized protein (DUF983 family)